MMACERIEVMSHNLVTTWIPGTVRPARPGVYQREFPSCALFAEWTGHQWLVAAGTAKAAVRKREVSAQQPDDPDCVRWRGLASPADGVRENGNG